MVLARHPKKDPTYPTHIPKKSKEYQTLIKQLFFPAYEQPAAMSCFTWFAYLKQ